MLLGTGEKGKADTHGLADSALRLPRVLAMDDMNYDGWTAYCFCMASPWMKGIG